MTDPYEAPGPAEVPHMIIVGIGWPVRILSVLAAVGALGLLGLAWLLWTSGRGAPYVAEQMAVTWALNGAFLAAGGWQLHRMARAARAARHQESDAVTNALLAQRTLFVIGGLYVPALVVEAVLYVLLARWLG